jgi:precorrin-3B C17-methyltransferase
MTDFAVVSMSDLLVPWEIIQKRVEAAAKGDFVIVIYNPSSKKRTHQLQETRETLLKYRKPTTPVAIIKGAYRESEAIEMTDLENLPKHSDTLGMTSTVIIGNSSTYTYKDLMINPRGYKSKYNLEEQTNPDLKV